MSEREHGVDEYAAYVDALEDAIRKATAHLPPGIDRAAVAVRVALGVVAEDPDRVRYLVRERPSAEAHAQLSYELALDRCATLLQDLLAGPGAPPRLSQAQARGAVSAILATALTALDAPPPTDLATVAAATTAMLGSLVHFGPPSDPSA